MRVVVLRKIPEEPSLLRQWDDLVLADGATRSVLHL